MNLTVFYYLYYIVLKTTYNLFNYIKILIINFENEDDFDKILLFLCKIYETTLQLNVYHSFFHY
jgi:hypothetical protein